MKPHRPAPSKRQRGAALLLAMIIVTLITTLAVSMVWQQWRAVQVETAERARSQSSWILSGALDWAGLILKEDARPSGGQPVDHLGEPWAVPLAEARLSTFLALDKDNAEDAPEAFFSGGMTDAQSRFNLRNLLNDSGEVSTTDLAALRRLCENLSVSVGAADVIANGLKEAFQKPGSPGASANPPLVPRRVEQLKWLGVEKEALRRLEPFVALLPQRTTVNINTAQREVIAAVIPGLNVGDAERLVQVRQRTPFRKQQDITDQLTGIRPEDLIGVSWVSRYFEVRGRLRLSDRVLEQRSLVERSAAGFNVLTSERISSTESGS